MLALADNHVSITVVGGKQNSNTKEAKMKNQELIARQLQSEINDAKQALLRRADRLRQQAEDLVNYAERLEEDKENGIEVAKTLTYAAAHLQNNVCGNTEPVALMEFATQIKMYQAMLNMLAE